MATQDSIQTTVFCNYHQVEHTFINSLEEHGLITLMLIGEQKVIPHDQLSNLEKMIRLHRELDINIEGIEAIVNMLMRVENLQQENLALRNKLRVFNP